ncbi:hypothetical protein J6P52_05225 [bacterium]|nr:hypothetical protein [bacterium]
MTLDIIPFSSSFNVTPTGKLILNPWIISSAENETLSNNNLYLEFIISCSIKFLIAVFNFDGYGEVKASLAVISLNPVTLMICGRIVSNQVATVLFTLSDVIFAKPVIVNVEAP